MTKDERALLRRLIANYMESEGCSCCRDCDRHELDRAALGKLLYVKKYIDGSGYNFSRYKERQP